MHINNIITIGRCPRISRYFLWMFLPLLWKIVINRKKAHLWSLLSYGKFDVQNAMHTSVDVWKYCLCLGDTCVMVPNQEESSRVCSMLREAQFQCGCTKKAFLSIHSFPNGRLDCVLKAQEATSGTLHWDHWEYSAVSCNVIYYTNIAYSPWKADRCHSYPFKFLLSHTHTHTHVHTHTHQWGTVCSIIRGWDSTIHVTVK